MVELCCLNCYLNFICIFLFGYLFIDYYYLWWYLFDKWYWDICLVVCVCLEIRGFYLFFFY